jgi:predicted lipid-binding transport protein (Tim44 family)
MRNPRRKVKGAVPVVAAFVTATSVLAQAPSPQQLGLFVYPAKNQPPAQQQVEETECYGWAQQQTGIDPTAPPPPPAPTQTGPDGGAIKGAAGGAAVGTAIGAIAGDTGEGAAIGAVAGALRGRQKSKQKQKQQQQQAQAQSQAAHAGARETFNKAYGACLEGKGYTVK